MDRVGSGTELIQRTLSLNCGERVDQIIDPVANSHDNFQTSSFR